MKKTILTLCILLSFNALSNEKDPKTELAEPVEQNKIFEKQAIGSNAIIDADPRSVLRNEESLLELENNILQKKIIKRERELELKTKENILEKVPAEYLKKPEEYFKKLEQEKELEKQKVLEELKPSPSKPVEFQIDLFTKINQEQEIKARKEPVGAFTPIPIVLPAPTPENTQQLDTSALNNNSVDMNKALKAVQDKVVVKKEIKNVEEKTVKKVVKKKVSSLPETSLVSSFKFGDQVSATFYAFYSVNGKTQRELFDNVKVGDVVNINKVNYVLKEVNTEFITLKKN